MKFWPRRSRPAPPLPPRANPTRIAVLEHDLLGIKPKPGTSAALSIALRQLGICFMHVPIDTSELGDQHSVGMCQQCGSAMLVNESGDWVVAEVRAATRDSE